jgi:hypothetical protein
LYRNEIPAATGAALINENAARGRPANVSSTACAAHAYVVWPLGYSGCAGLAISVDQPDPDRPYRCGSP